MLAIEGLGDVSSTRGSERLVRLSYFAADIILYMRATQLSCRGTKGSNPSPSSEESCEPRFLAILLRSRSGTDGSNPLPSSEESCELLLKLMYAALIRAPLP